jgi:DNA-binding CsgD family transcriptional regulator
MAFLNVANTEDPLKSGLDVVAKRVPFRIILLDESYTIVFAEWDNGAAYFRTLGLTGPDTQLPQNIEALVRRTVESFHGDAGRHDTIKLASGALIRVSVLVGSGTALIALCIELGRRREELLGAVRRFNLTPREAEVLSHVLAGLTASQIAETLSIAKTTVNDYFKSLLRKTHAVNRSDMVARVLDWNGCRPDVKTDLAHWE